GSSPRYLTEVNGTLFLTAFTPEASTELWKSDGTEKGTVLVKDIYPGSRSSFPRDLVNVNGTLLFVAEDETHGSELWRSDGTEKGTTLVLDINPGDQRSNARELTAVNGTLFFNAGEGPLGGLNVELWKSDGTGKGTVQVRDIFPGN